MTDDAPDPGSSIASSAGTGISRRRMLQAAAGVAAGALAVDVSGAKAAVADDTGESALAGEPPATVPAVDSGDRLTTNQGVRISDDQNQLRAGSRGPSLLEDSMFREKIMHFDHERIPERVVHARGAGAHGVFRLHTSLQKYTMARVLTDTAASTDVFVRFSTVNGSRGSADTARDARGFATKFYTAQGVWDLVGNNIPVFFIQDAIKFPDLVHSFKPEPDVEIPQASTAHDTFWDYVSLTPESMHMIMWIMSDRAIPRSYRMMEGFGVHTFRLISSSGQSTFVKFHWKPALGVHSLVWNEAQRLAGVDPDYHRRDLAAAIDAGEFPQWDLGVQLLGEHDVAKVTFDVLDATKLWPEEIVPVRRIGTMTLNRNPANYFAETEQVAFHVGHLVAGIDVTDDPLLQGRLFSYLDTQINRFGSANFSQLPINAPRSPVNNFQQDSAMRYANRPGRVNYEPNSLAAPVVESPASQAGFVSYPEPVAGPKVRARSASFGDYYSQATLFYRSLSGPEQLHVIQALQFELGKVRTTAVKQRMLTHLANIDTSLVTHVSASLGLQPPRGHINASLGTSSALSEDRTPKSPRTRKVAVLVADGVRLDDVTILRSHLTANQIGSDIIAPHEGVVTGAGGHQLTVTCSLLTAASVQYDAVFVPGGASAPTLAKNGDALHFVAEAYKHFKSIASTGTGAQLVTTALGSFATQAGVRTANTGADLAPLFIADITADRHWTRIGTDSISA